MNITRKNTSSFVTKQSAGIFIILILIAGYKSPVLVALIYAGPF